MLLRQASSTRPFSGDDSLTESDENSTGSVSRTPNQWSAGRTNPEGSAIGAGQKPIRESPRAKCFNERERKQGSQFARKDVFFGNWKDSKLRV